MRIWEVEPAVFLSTPGLLPYATLAQSDAPEGMLRQVVARLEALPDLAQRNNLIAATGILSGLRLDRDTIARVIRSEVMRESVIYQDILAEGEARGEARLVMRLLNRRFGEIAAGISTQIQQLTVVQLEELGEALLDFSSLADLEGWLSRN